MVFERRPQLKSRRHDVSRVTGDNLKLIERDEPVVIEISLLKNLSKSLDAHLASQASRHDDSVSKFVIRRRGFLRRRESLVRSLIAHRVVQNVFKLFHRHRSGIILIEQAPRKVHVRLRARVVELRQTEHELERADVPISRDVEQGHHPRQERVRRAQSKHFRKLLEFDRPFHPYRLAKTHATPWSPCSSRIHFTSLSVSLANSPPREVRPCAKHAPISLHRSRASAHRIVDARRMNE